MRLDVKVQDNSVAIVGWHDGGAGQVQAWLDKVGDYQVACFVNPTNEPLKIDPSEIQRDTKVFSYPTETTFKDKPFINSADWVTILRDLNIKNVLVTTDYPAHQRLELINMARKEGLKLINAIHPSVVIMEDVILHDNIILQANTFIGYRAELYPGVIVTSAHIDHHNVLRECASIGPGVVCAGNVTVGPFARVHPGATVINRIKIGQNSIVGAGTLVLRDVPDHVTVLGVPAKVVKSNNFQDP